MSDKREKIVYVAAGHSHTVFLGEAGKVYACGSGLSGELDIGDWRSHRACATSRSCSTQTGACGWNVNGQRSASATMVSSGKATTSSNSTASSGKTTMAGPTRESWRRVLKLVEWA